MLSVRLRNQLWLSVVGLVAGAAVASCGRTARPHSHPPVYLSSAAADFAPWPGDAHLSAQQRARIELTLEGVAKPIGLTTPLIAPGAQIYLGYGSGNSELTLSVDDSAVIPKIGSAVNPPFPTKWQETAEGYPYYIQGSKGVTETILMIVPHQFALEIASALLPNPGDLMNPAALPSLCATLVDQVRTDLA